MITSMNTNARSYLGFHHVLIADQNQSAQNMKEIYSLIYFQSHLYVHGYGLEGAVTSAFIYKSECEFTREQSQVTHLPSVPPLMCESSLKLLGNHFVYKTNATNVSYFLLPFLTDKMYLRN